MAQWWRRNPLSSSCNTWWNERRTSAWEDEVWYFYRQDLPQAALPVFRLLTGRFWGFSPRRGETLNRSRSNLAAPPCQIWPGSVQGWGFTTPKTEKKWNFTNIIAPKGRVPCTIFTKFTSFMRVLSLHNSAKFGCFISINDKIINNLLRWGRFQPNFRRPLSAKLWMGAKNVWPKMMARTTSITMQNFVEIARRKSAREDEMWCFHFF